MTYLEQTNENIKFRDKQYVITILTILSLLLLYVVSLREQRSDHTS